MVKKTVRVALDDLDAEFAVDGNLFEINLNRSNHNGRRSFLGAAILGTLGLAGRGIQTAVHAATDAIRLGITRSGEPAADYLATSATAVREEAAANVRKGADMVAKGLEPDGQNKAAPPRRSTAGKQRGPRKAPGQKAK